MTRLTDVWTVVYALVIWAGFIVGIVVEDPWLAAPAAFLILLETLDAR